MAVHPMAALHARGLPWAEAAYVAQLEPAQVEVMGEAGGEDAQHLVTACRALLYKCPSCELSKPYTEYSRDSLGCELCETCFDAAGVENAHADGHHEDEPEPDCPECFPPDGSPGNGCCDSPRIVTSRMTGEAHCGSCGTF